MFKTVCRDVVCRDVACNVSTTNGIKYLSGITGFILFVFGIHHRTYCNANANTNSDPYTEIMNRCSDIVPIPVPMAIQVPKISYFFISIKILLIIY